MKNIIVTLVVIGAVFLNPVASSADEWTEYEQLDRVIVNMTTYGHYAVMVRTVSGITYKFQRPPEKVEEVKLYEAILLTAFSTQREVQIYHDGPDGDGNIIKVRMR